MLEEWLNSKTISVCDSVNNWQDAIKLSAKPLLSANIITSDYITAIFTEHKKIGPYYVLAPGIAMPHARPEEGANQQGLSLLLVKQGVSFGSEDNDPVYLIIMLAATDSKSHLAMIAELMSLLSSETSVAQIMRARTVNEIETIIAHHSSIETME